jgi:hypothetical protein
VSAATANQKLASKSVASDELVVHECEAQNKLHVHGDAKKIQEHLLESTQKTLSERDYSSSTMISLAVAHAMVLLKSHTPDLDRELLRRDYPFDDDEERDTLIESVFILLNTSCWG